MTSCKAKIADHTGFHFYGCGKPAVTDAGYCRTHDPECRATRAKKRGPTKWEREMAAEKAMRDELATLRAYRERTEAVLRDLCAEAGNSPSDFQFVAEADLRRYGLWREAEK